MSHALPVTTAARCTFDVRRERVIGKADGAGHRRFRLLSLLWLVSGLALSTVLGSLAAFGSFLPSADYRIMVASSVASFVGAAIVIRYVRRFALTNLWAILIWTVIGSGLLVLLVLGLVNADFSLIFLACFDLCTLAALGIWVLMIQKIQYLKLALVPSGLAEEVLHTNHPQIEYTVLSSPEDLDHDPRLGGVVVDVDSPLEERWLRAVSEWSAGRLRIYRATELFEAVTGRTSLSRISAGIVADFTGSPLYKWFKRAGDVVAVVVFSPIIVLLILVVSVIVRLESPGHAIFAQKRVGIGGRIFTAYKIRSMTCDSEADGPQFAAKDDKRITRVGSFIRKYRIDEFPQLWNVFLGQMSIIGPRPEQPKFVEEYGREIPYYQYRHEVRPGLTGWAQVHQGYTDDAAATREKLEYDLYYIKHLSFWLDVLIVFKTAGTILTGFGAR